MRILSRIIIFNFIGLSVLFANRRIQIEPYNFTELNLRYRNLQHFQPSYLLERPFLYSPNSQNAFLFQIHPHISLEKQTNIPGLTTWMQLQLNKGVVLVNEVQIKDNSNQDPNYIGKEWRGLTGTTLQSFLQWSKSSESKSNLLIRAGRIYSQLGPGRSGQLLLGARARPLDQISFSFARNLNKLISARFYYQTAVLDKTTSHNRYLALHRLEILGKNWYFTFSEAFLYSRQNQGFDAVYLNPFLFYHGEQYNGPDLAGNTIGTVELGYSWKTNHVYCEVLIDDIQLENNIIDDLEPNEVGLLTGYERASKNYYLSAEGAFITNRTYKTPDRSEWFIHRNEPIGYELGSDIARLNLLNRYYFKERWHLDTELDMIWQGEGDMNKDWDSPWEDPEVTVQAGYSESFPTGIVEQSTLLSLEALRHWTPERWISFGLAYESVQNVDNKKGADSNGWRLKLAGSWALNYEILFEE